MADRRLQSTRKQQLREHIGLTESQAELLLNEGYEFVRELEFIDYEVRNEISERYGTTEMVEIHLANLPPGTEPPGMPTVPAFTRDGRSLYEAMDSDGLTDLYRDKKQAAFKTHWESLAEILGLYPLVRIETFMKTEMAPGILKTQFTPPPLPTGEALQECLLLLTGTSETGRIE